MDPSTPAPASRDLEEGILFALWSSLDNIEKYKALRQGANPELLHWIEKLDYPIHCLADLMSEAMFKADQPDLRDRWKALHRG